jgi:multidrug resistance efflux pump
MLNLSQHPIADRIHTDRYRSFGMLRSRYTGKWTRRAFIVFAAVVVIVLLLPWTQNIQSSGSVTVLDPMGRPQDVPATIPGRIEQWHVRDGDVVAAGDTLVVLSEVQQDYVDPELLQRTEEQLAAKQAAAAAYRAKAEALLRSITALRGAAAVAGSTASNEIERARLMASSDSLNYAAAAAGLAVAEAQYTRQRALYEQGLKSLTELEARSIALQDARADENAARNAWDRSRAALRNAQLARSNVPNDFGDALAKAEADLSSAEAAAATAAGEAAELMNTLANLRARRGWRTIVAPQAGRVTRLLQAGIGEQIAAGVAVLTLVPVAHGKAVEWKVRPMDLPLIHVGSEVRFLFDGWPALVFSGWPELTFGTFSGKVVAIDRTISEDGTFRVLVAEGETGRWPEAVLPGSGARGIALLNRVPVWYELWRQLNGFPQDYYTP